MALILGAGAAGVWNVFQELGEGSDSDEGGAPAPAPPSEFPVGPVPDPDARFRHTCGSATGDGSELTRTGYRFTGKTTVVNTGNIGVEVMVRAVWRLSPGRTIAEPRVVRVPFDGKRRIDFLFPTTAESISAHRAVTAVDNCTASVKLLDTFGPAH